MKKLQQNTCWHQIFIAPKFMKYEGKVITDKSLFLRFLQKNVVLDQTLTLHELWDYIYFNKKQICEIFPAYVSMNMLQQMHKQINIAPSTQIRFTKVTLGKYSFIAKRANKSNSIHTQTRMLVKKKGKKQPYAVDFVCLADMKKLPISILPPTIYLTICPGVDTCHSQQFVCNQSELSFTLYEVIQCILANTTLWGDPIERQSKKIQIFSSIEKQLESKEKTIPFKKAFKKIKKSLKKK